MVSLPPRILIRFLHPIIEVELESHRKASQGPSALAGMPAFSASLQRMSFTTPTDAIANLSETVLPNPTAKHANPFVITWSNKPAQVSESLVRVADKNEAADAADAELCHTGAVWT